MPVDQHGEYGFAAGRNLTVQAHRAGFGRLGDGRVGFCDAALGKERVPRFLQRVPPNSAPQDRRDIDALPRCRQRSGAFAHVVVGEALGAKGESAEIRLFTVCGFNPVDTQVRNDARVPNTPAQVAEFTKGLCNWIAHHCEQRHLERRAAGVAHAVVQDRARNGARGDVHWHEGIERFERYIGRKTLVFERNAREGIFAYERRLAKTRQTGDQTVLESQCTDVRR